MSFALQNQIDDLNAKVKLLTEQVEQLTKMLKPHEPEKRGPGRPPKTIGHMQQ